MAATNGDLSSLKAMHSYLRWPPCLPLPNTGPADHSREGSPLPVRARKPGRPAAGSWSSEGVACVCTDWAHLACRDNMARGLCKVLSSHSAGSMAMQIAPLQARVAMSGSQAPINNHCAGRQHDVPVPPCCPPTAARDRLPQRSRLGSWWPTLPPPTVTERWGSG